MCVDLLGRDGKPIRARSNGKECPAILDTQKANTLCSRGGATTFFYLPNICRRHIDDRGGIGGNGDFLDEAILDLPIGDDFSHDGTQ